MNAGEKWAVGALATLGVLMFFFPVLTVKVPIAGGQSRTGYDVVVASRGVNDVTETLSSSTETSTSTAEAGEMESIQFPLSLRFAPLIHVSVAVAFLAALAVIAGVMFSFSIKVAAIGSLLGTVAGILAIVHVRVLNSDIHQVFQEELAKHRSDSSDNPFAGLAEDLSQLFAGSINILPGVGLYVLSACLGLSFVLLKTRILARVTIAPGPSGDGM